MLRTHSYRTSTTWDGNLGAGTATYQGYDRDHRTTSPGRPPILSSSDPAFHGDASRWNPELLLVASLSQCHMLWYLSLCATHGVVVESYEDTAEGSMQETADGGGHFVEVVLRPVVTVAANQMLDQAQALHGRAADLCFIAASVNFPVRHEPQILVNVSAEAG